MGNASRAKGLRRERELAKLVGGERVPLSGAAGGSFSADVRMPNGWRVEVKARAAGLKSLYAWLAGADVLALKADRQDWLAVLPAARFPALLGAEAPGGFRPESGSPDGQ